MATSFRFYKLTAFLFFVVPAESAPTLRGSEGTARLCDPDIVAETCKMMDPSDSTHVDLVKISKALSATHKATMRFWKALKLTHEHEKCQEFCQQLVELLSHDGIHLPHGHDLGCFEDKNGHTDCSRPLGTKDVSNFVDHTEHDLADYHQEEELVEIQPQQSDVPEHQKLDYTVDQMALRVANLFRIYPEIKVYITERVEHVATDNSMTANFRVGGSSEWQFLTQVNSKAHAYVATASRMIMSWSADGHLKKWFGRKMASDDTEIISEVQRVLNSIDLNLANAHYVDLKSTCMSQSGGWVYPRGEKCDAAMLDSKSYNCATTIPDGKPVFYFCNRFRQASYLPETQSEMIETLVHHFASHAVGYTEDVKVPWEEGRWATTRLYCYDLALKNPKLSLKNSYSYIYFIQDLTDWENTGKR